MKFPDNRENCKNYMEKSSAVSYGVNQYYVPPTLSKFAIPPEDPQIKLQSLSSTFTSATSVLRGLSLAAVIAQSLIAHVNTQHTTSSSFS